MRRTRESGEPYDVTEPEDFGTVEVEDEALSGGFVMTPWVVQSDAKLLPTARLVYGVLLHYSWQTGSCFPGQDRLSIDAGLSKRTIVTALQELEKHGYLAKRRRGQGRTNVYTLLSLKGRSAKEDDPRSAKFNNQAVQNLHTEYIQVIDTDNTSTLTAAAAKNNTHASTHEAAADALRLINVKETPTRMRALAVAMEEAETKHPSVNLPAIVQDQALWYEQREEEGHPIADKTGRLIEAIKRKAGEKAWQRPKEVGRSANGQALTAASMERLQKRAATTTKPPWQG